MIERKKKISETVDMKIQGRQFIWYEHVMRRTENIILRIAVQYRPTFKKQRRRLRRTEFNGVREGMKKRGVEKESA